MSPRCAALLLELLESPETVRGWVRRERLESWVMSVVGSGGGGSRVLVRGDVDSGWLVKELRGRGVRVVRVVEVSR